MDEVRQTADDTDHGTKAPAILVVTGASGAGKTTLVRALDAVSLDSVGCYYFDDIGVPSAEEMKERFGGGAEWQAWATDEWITRLLLNTERHAVAVLDAQVRVSTVLEAVRKLGGEGARAQVVLVDCGHAERNARLRGPRGQPDLATPDMDCWAAYLRGQADALGLPIIDTANRTPDESAAELVAHVRALLDPSPTHHSPAADRR